MARGGARTADHTWTALPFVAPFAIVYAALFLYPSIQMLGMSFTNGQLILPGEWVGLGNYLKLVRDWRLGTATVNTLYFVAMTVVPSTLLGLALALVVGQLRGWVAAAVLAIFFLPYILPVSTVVSVGLAFTSVDAGPLGWLIQWTTGESVGISRTPRLVLPAAAILTVWWTTGFNVLLFIGGLKAIPPELYEAARLDGAGAWQRFRALTWPLIWPVTALVATIQLITQMKVFDQVYLMVQGGRIDATMVLVQYIYTLAFQRNQGGYAATVAVALFVLVASVSVLQFQLLRTRGST